MSSAWTMSSISWPECQFRANGHHDVRLTCVESNCIDVRLDFLARKVLDHPRCVHSA
jgi:hypothetical protein